MHHALDLLEILYNVFGHLASDEDRARTYAKLSGNCALAKVARTCRAFKEPALDVLWSELPDLSALARCVPNAVHLKQQCYYAFKRPLTEVEWATIQSYARRVWSFLDCSLRGTCLEEESSAMLFNHTDGTLFPSLRFLSWGYGKPFPLLYIASQPLRTLHLDCRCSDITECRDILKSVGNFCSRITAFRLQRSRQDVEFDTIVSNLVLRWSGLQILECSRVALSADAILHLSRIPTLTRLSFVLSEDAPCQILSYDFVLVFRNLTWCEISAVSLLPLAELFARVRLVAIKELAVRFYGSPSKLIIQSFMSALTNACSSGTLTHLSILSQRYLLRQLSSCGGVDSSGYSPITYEDLSSCAALGSLRSFKIDFDQPIDLTDDDLVNLGSSWPHLEDLSVNHDAGWRSTGGLTLHGLVRLLRACPALCHFCILFDTPTFTRIPEGMDISYPQRQFGRVNLVESPLEADIFADVVHVFVAIGFLPRLLMAWRRVETGPRTSVDLAQAACRSWRHLYDEVKVIMTCPSEREDKRGVRGRSY